MKTSEDEKLLVNELSIVPKPLSVKEKIFIFILSSVMVVSLVSFIFGCISGPHYIGLVLNAIVISMAGITAHYIYKRKEVHIGWRILWIIAFILLFMLCVLYLVIYILGMMAAPPKDVFPEQCHRVTNCVRYTLNGTNVQVDGLKFLWLTLNDTNSIKEKISDWGANTVTLYKDSTLIHLRFTTLFWGFQDDFFARVVVVDGLYGIEFQSESRLGIGDFGVNRARVNTLYNYMNKYISPISDIFYNISTDMNWELDPCSDFYLFACGSWLNNTQLPPDKAVLSRSFTAIRDRNFNILKDIAETVNDVKLKLFYYSCLNLEEIDKLGAEPLQPDLEMIPNNIQNTSELMTVTAKLYKEKGISPFFSFYPSVYDNDPTIMIGVFHQGGLGLPAISLYKNSTIAAKYTDLIQTLFTYTNQNYSADSVVELETAISSFTLPPDELLDPFKLNNNMTFSNFSAQASNLSLDSFFNGLQLPDQEVVVTVPEYFTNLSQIILQMQHAWVPYLKWNVIRSRANLLSTNISTTYFNFFSKYLRGIDTPEPRWKQCIDSTDNSLGELLGKYFINRTFSESDNSSAYAIVNGIISSMEKDLQSLSWMDNDTMNAAQNKIKNIRILIGGPTNPRNYSDVIIHNNYFENVESSIAAEMIRNINQIGQPTDYSEWFMTAPTVNAYYEPTRNQMVFPAGILQSPFFFQSISNINFNTLNYGAFGVVSGHELTHGFDNQGRYYDWNGKLSNWWQNITNEKFEQKATCVSQQYDNFHPLPNITINGNLTLGENIADMGGVKLSWMKFITSSNSMGSSLVPGLTQMQLYFISFAQLWCTKVTDAYLKLQVQTDPHSPAHYRVLGPLMNSVEFSNTFNCSNKSPMNPINKCEVW